MLLFSGSPLPEASLPFLLSEYSEASGIMGLCLQLALFLLQLNLCSLLATGTTPLVMPPAATRAAGLHVEDDVPTEWENGRVRLNATRN